MHSEGSTSDADEESVHSPSDPEPPKDTGIGQVRFEDGYREAAAQPADPSKTIRYRQRRLALMISIPEVDNNADRLHHIVTEVNTFMKVARKHVANFRLRKFDDISTPTIASRVKWRTKMNPDSSADFREYIQGYFPFTPPRGGPYRLRINVVMNAEVTLPVFLENVTHDWGQKDSRSISDIKAQRIWDPVKIGYLMRASRYLTHSYELVEALETAAAKEANNAVYFGISWGTIPSPVGGYDKDTAVQGVMLETNRDSVEVAVGLLKKWYPLNPRKPAEPPFPGNYRFVLNRDNLSVKGNPVALSNLSVLMERQGIFNKDTLGEQSFCLKDLNMPYKGDRSISVRDKLLQTKVKTLGDELIGSPLFLSISSAVNNRSGHKSVWFTFHRKVAQEAISIVRNLPTFIESEWAINPDYMCYAQFINSANSWDAKHRVANNEDTDDIKMAADVYTTDLQPEQPTTEPVSTDDADSMTSKARKEMRRMMDNDVETIYSVSQEKSIQPRPSAIVINDDASGMSAVSGASSKTSVIKARLQREFNEQMKIQTDKVEKLQRDKAIQDRQFAQLTAQLAQLQAVVAKAQLSPTNTFPLSDIAVPHESEKMALHKDTDVDFDTTAADADHADFVGEIENRIIAKLDHDPTPDELVEITMAANRLASQLESSPTEDVLPSESSNDSEDIKSPVRSQMMRSFQDSDEDSDQHQSPTGQKRTAVTASDEDSASENQFSTSSSTSPKKQFKITGGQSPVEDG